MYIFYFVVICIIYTNLSVFDNNHRQNLILFSLNPLIFQHLGNLSKYTLLYIQINKALFLEFHALYNLHCTLKSNTRRRLEYHTAIHVDSNMMSKKITITK